MEGRKDMVMFLEGGQLGTLVGKRVPGLAEAVGSPAPDPQDKMMHRSCLSPRAGPPLAPRERAAGEDEEVEVLPGAGTGPEGRSAAAALLSAGQPAAPEPLAAKGQQSSSDTESDFYEEIEVSCTPDCAAGSAAEYQHSKGTARRRLCHGPLPRATPRRAGQLGPGRCPAKPGQGLQLGTFPAEAAARPRARAGPGSEPVCLLCLPQVWFQNRRMKDKRQRLAMTWPHPADPAFYTYMMSHAAATGNLPYPFPSHLPLPYYSHMGIGATSASAAAPFSTPLRPLDTFRVLSHPYPRPELLCAFRHPSLYPAPTHGLGSAGGGPCSCLACHSSQSNGLAQRPSGSDFTCSATTRTDSFLTFTPSVLSKATSVPMDQREEVPLTR
ncbi:PREDICTED: homeobox even-skipped homolog protein 1 [Crocodylus porosus]|uniref:homeobox even-skipped homolog protein 1 n=1 Tax=Crocodylus porosus TaxID=8502 RepID=UPI00093A5B06|nr:PREDICTED: homeobox even-skipped homolog protein 1 [Crocodylus porosus]